MKIDNNTVLVFDLDDTIYKEIDFVKSAYKEIARIIELQIGINIYQELFQLFEEKKDVFEIVLAKYKIVLNLQDLIDIYRYHKPKIFPVKEILEFILKNKKVAYSFALITDGRSVTQRNKLEALNLMEVFKNNIFISQEVGYNKLQTFSFTEIEKRFPNKNFIYFGDNPKKDFIIANNQGWQTIQIQDSNNIHDSYFQVSAEFEAQKKVAYKFFTDYDN